MLLEARVCVYVERDVAPQPVECQKEEWWGGLAVLCGCRSCSQERDSRGAALQLLFLLH